MSIRVIDREIKTIEVMLGIYCHGKLHQKAENESLCNACHEIFSYAKERLKKCPHGNAKPKCSRCNKHCFKPSMRKQIISVMRYAGPKMLTKHPLTMLRHILRK